MADIYRKSSMEKLSNPEQLDRTITISSPLSWLALIGVALIIAAVIVWSIFGTIPTTANVSGIIVDPMNTGAVYSDQSGAVEKLHVKIGDTIAAGADVATVKLSSGENYVIKAAHSGKVSEILVMESAQAAEFAGAADPSRVFPGTEVIRYTPDVKEKQTVVCYVPLATAQQYKEGMEVLVFPNAVDSQKYGHMTAKVIGVGEYPVSSNNLSYVIGAGNYIDNQLLANGPIVSVICELTPDSSTASGYYWSGKKGADLTIPNGSFVSAQIIIEKTSPISKLITGIKDKMEG